DHEHEKEEDKHDDHEHEKKEDKHDEHDHSDKESHSDVDAVWAFHCDKPANIETVNVKIFSAFPGGFEEIAVEWITAADAGKTDLKEDGEISLKP
ncbi:MAG: ZrgA family zinc uptake protein, partial [Thiolinea sp.]